MFFREVTPCGFVDLYQRLEMFFSSIISVQKQNHLATFKMASESYSETFIQIIRRHIPQGR